MNDKKTRDICEMDLAGPVTAKPTARELAKARAARFKEKHGVIAVTLQLPADLARRLDSWAKANGKNKSAAVAKVIESQLLRKR